MKNNDFTTSHPTLSLDNFLQLRIIYAQVTHVYHNLQEEAVMLLMNKSGRIYDVPDQMVEKYVATDWSASREAIDDMLSTLRKPASASSESVQDGCCNAYANYCPNR